MICKYQWGDPINTVADWVKSLNGKNHVYLALPSDLAQQIRSHLGSNNPDFLDRISIIARLSDSDLSNIPEQVKNRVLDWACDLESAGVTGGGQTFSEKEKADAKMVVFNIYNSNIDQLSSSGANLKREN